MLIFEQSMIGPVHPAAAEDLAIRVEFAHEQPVALSRTMDLCLLESGLRPDVAEMLKKWWNAEGEILHEMKTQGARVIAVRNRFDKAYVFCITGAASGDRTHDILSHSQAFCR
jgi:hypothetical protein